MDGWTMAGKLAECHRSSRLTTLQSRAIGQKWLAFCRHLIMSVVIGEHREKNPNYILIMTVNNIYLTLLGTFGFWFSTSNLSALFFFKWESCPFPLQASRGQSYSLPHGPSSIFKASSIFKSFFFFKHLYWSIIALQWCVSFCFITK